MMMKGILSFSVIQSQLFIPFKAKMEAFSCPQLRYWYAFIGLYSTKRKEYYFIGFPVMLASGVMRSRMLLPKLVFWKDLAIQETYQ